MAHQQQLAVEDREHILLQYSDTRNRSIAICDPLSVEDYVIQTMPDVSPPKWHLAHTSWFFETFLLKPYDVNYKIFHPLFDALFNSYYVTHGEPYPRPQRGLLSRPTVEQVIEYRQYVDTAMQQLIHSASTEEWLTLSALVTLGINHEQQHQELLLTDIKHILAANPLQPVYRKLAALQNTAAPGEILNLPAMSWISIKGGTVAIGQTENHGIFSYDNEGPVHKVHLEDFSLASRCITNKEYLEFIEDGGYQQAELWLSDGWAVSQQQKWCAPLYWQNSDTGWQNFTYEGMQEVDLNAPVCHISYYEADAYATWAEKRLPTEQEWELAANQLPVAGNLFEEKQYKPVRSTQTQGSTEAQTINQMFGDVWEWTSSAYAAYPGYKPADGAIGEYNGKFMSNQMVLRGGSFATAKDHIRASYRNFFHPGDRWQFSGIRLADEN